MKNSGTPAFHVPSNGFHMLDFDTVEAELVRCAELWMRTPREGHRAVRAGDGPWSLVLPDRGIDAAPLDDEAGLTLRALPLSCAEVADRDRVSEWLAYAAGLPGVAGLNGAQIVAKVVAVKARKGFVRVGWRHLFKGEAGLAQRCYGRAVGYICRQVNQELARRADVPDVLENQP